MAVVAVTTPILKRAWRPRPGALARQPSRSLPSRRREGSVTALATACCAVCCGQVRRWRRAASRRRAAAKEDGDGHEQPSLSGSVFVWQTPLTLPSPFPSAFAEVLPRHSVVLVECVDGGVVALDFEPRESEKGSLAATVQLLLGSSVQGSFGLRKLRRLPRGAVRVGRARPGVTLEAVERVRGSFDSRLSLSNNDCNAYAAALLSALLEEPERPTGNRLYSTLDPEALEKKGEAVYKEPSLPAAVGFIAGTTVGAGILALPAVTQPVGFLPSTAALLLSWLYMASTGLLIAEVALADMAVSGKVATSLQSMAAQNIGQAGAVLSSLSFIVVHYGLLVAYLSRGGELLASLLPAGLAASLPPPALFASACGGLVFLTKGTDAIEVANNAFALMVLLSFAALVALALPAAEPGRLVAVVDWGQTSQIVPTLLLSLVFHNVVPSVCAQLEGDREKITTAILLGSFLPLVMFLAWNGVILAAVAPSATITDPLDALRESGGSALGSGVILFSLSAIVTSFIGFVVALTDFFADALRGTSDKSQTPSAGLEKVRDFLLTLGPPLVLACYDPSLFFQAIDKAGAFGVSLLFGLLPAWMAWANRLGESPALLRRPGLRGGYVRAPLVPGGLSSLLVVGLLALLVVLQNALELLLG